MLFLSTCFVGLASCILIYLMHQFGSFRSNYIHVYFLSFVLLFALHNVHLIAPKASLFIDCIYIAGALCCLLGPSIYLYVLRILQKQTQPFKKVWFHFLPFVLYLIIFFSLLIHEGLKTDDLPKQLINQCLELIASISEDVFVHLQILLILIPMHVLGYLLLSLYQVVKEDSIDQNLVNTSTTMRILVYLFLLFHAYVAIMYGIACFIIFYECNFSATKTNHFPPENFTGSEHGIAALVALVFITTGMVLSNNYCEQPSHLSQKSSK